MKVLLTRPEGRNGQMQQALAERGVAFMVTPLLCVESIAVSPEALRQAKKADMLIFISTTAVTHAATLFGSNWPTSRYYAVGEATAAALEQLGLNVTRAPDDCQQTEGLLQLPDFDQVSGRKIGIIRGEGGRETLAETLSQRGAKVNYLEVYRRGCPPLEPQATVAAWQAFGIDTLLLTSGEVLDNLLKLVPKECFAWLNSCHIIVPSCRVEAQARDKGLTRVTNAGAANHQAMLDALSL
ncbi:uroporphyrinogen-III synthase [Shewanella cyperi]|uniref:Uroporphyrinogen-III synthase n=1 Tax=Shewanella cyperi TaxID=2814292 RepID=A0A975ALZ6_9GAMM|nr:uroporphyrinogen-III synthase [Shewanella cyperi]QSX31962.1 uroporphyrinogen-III synthase [Shewanella cyperi]